MDFKKVHKYTKNLAVLYVEDDKQLRDETFEIFKDFFFQVDSAENGKDALELYTQYFQKHSFYYDLVITDINMSIMDGQTLIKKIDKINDEQAIIVVSAYNESSRLIDLIQQGITNFVLKPITPLQLMDMLHRTCKGICAQKELRELTISLDNQVKIKEKEIFSTQRISIETISNMIEDYDDETGGHIRRIEKYSALLLNHLSTQETNKYDPTLLRQTPFASLLHDIGKIMVPKDILTKPGKLDNDEFVIMKTHAKLGGDVLKRANENFKKEFGKDSYLKIASNIAMHHHERWDGSGYPDNLKGEEIPICARIVAIADVYDALVHKRVYKKAFTHERAVQIIKNEREIHFDPQLVDIFLDIHNEFEAISKEQEN